MQAHSNIFISKLKVQDKVVYIKLLWKEDKNIIFQIQIFDDYDNSSWSGTFSNQLAENCRKTFEYESKKDYMNNVRLALTGCSDSFVYDFVADNSGPGIKIFKWKKVFDDSAIVAHGSVPVYKVTESKSIILDFLIEENIQLHNAIEKCNKRNVEISEDLEKCKRELVDFVKMKTTLEQTLYGKFVQLLNAKKQRIQFLEESLEKS